MSSPVYQFSYHVFAYLHWASLVAQLVKKSACNVGDLGSIPGLGRSPGEGKVYPPQYSGLYFRLTWVGMKPSLCKDQPDSFYFSAGEVRVCVGDT